MTPGPSPPASGSGWVSGSADRVELRGLRVSGVCGVLPEEQIRAQPLEIDLDLHLDLAAAGRSDALDDTVDYGAVVEAVAQRVEIGKHQLLEHLAERLADEVLEQPRVEAVTVAVRKLRPPVRQHLSTAGVRITRRRPA